MVYSVDKSFTENKEKVDAAAAGEIESAIAEAKTALGGDDSTAMNNAFERLQTSSHKLAEALYSQAGTATGGDAGAQQEQASSASAGADSGAASGSDDNVIDAEYVDVEEGKR